MKELSKDLISQFVAVVNNKPSTNRSDVYGTVVNTADGVMVRIDGSDILTPMTGIVDAQDGDRVLINVIDHRATVTGNFTYPPSQRDTLAAKDMAEEAFEAANKAEESANNAFDDANEALGKANEASGQASEAKDKSEEALAKSQQAITSAQDATTAANQATQDVADVQQSIVDINEDLDDIFGAADTIVTLVVQAMDDSADALEASTLANTKADQAAQAAANAQSTADQAVTKAGEAQTAADQATQSAEDALAGAAAIRADVAAAEQEIANLGNSLTTLSNTMTADYAKKTDLASVEADLSTRISQNASGIELNAAKITEVDETFSQAAADAMAAAQTAKATADQATVKANEASEEATKAQTAADQAKAAATEAQNAADTAQAAADAADAKAVKADQDLADAKANLETVKGRVDATEEDIAAAQEAVNAAQAAANKAKEDATAATTAANEAKQTANQASSDASAAQTKADEAATNASNAKTEADTAVETANAAQTTATDAQTKAQNAQSVASQAVIKAEEAQSVANTAKTNAATAQTKANEAATAATNAQTAANAADAKAQAAQTDLNTAKANLEAVKGRVDATEEDIAAAEKAVEDAQAAADQAKADAATAQSTADKAKSDAATAQSAANTAKNAADAAQDAADAAQADADKALADVGALSKRVTTAETNISQNAEAIKLAATKTEVATTLGGYSTTAQMNAAIEAKANVITSSVSSTYATKAAVADVKTAADAANAFANNAKNNFGYQYKYTITASGDADKFYPLILRGGDQSVNREIFIRRSYSDLAPPEWHGHETVHGYTLSMKIVTNYGGWGGATYRWYIKEYSDAYGKAFADAMAIMSGMGFAIMLKGGGTTGATYHIYSDQQLEINHPTGVSPNFYYNSDLFMYNNDPTYKWYAPTPRSYTTEEIEAKIASKLFSDSQVTQLSSLIEQKEDSILMSVSSIYQSKADMANYVTSATLELTASGLTSRLNTAESNISTVSTNLGNYQLKTIPDTRNDSQTPKWYLTNYPKQQVTEFKYCNVIGLSGVSETYCSLTTIVAWGDSSGGYPKQVAKVDGKEFWRRGTSDTAWSAWIDASATATNYLNFSTAGLVVGDMTASTLGRNVLIGATSVDIRNGSTVLSTFGADSARIGVTTGKYVTVDKDIGLSIYNAGTLCSRFSDKEIYLGKNDNQTKVYFGDGYGYITGEKYTYTNGTEYTMMQLYTEDKIRISADDTALYSSDNNVSADVKTSVNLDDGTANPYRPSVKLGINSYNKSYDTVFGYLHLYVDAAKYEPSLDVELRNSTDGLWTSMYTTPDSVQVIISDSNASTGSVHLTRDRFTVRIDSSPVYVDSTSLTLSATKAIKWDVKNYKNPFFGYATDQTDGTFVWSITGTNYASGLAIGGGSGNLLYKANVVLHAGNWSSYCAPASHTHDYAPSSHNHSAANITSGTLAVARGGTGVTSNPSMLVNLGSTSAASVFAASPRPGITGTLGIGNGGTGATTAAAARANLATWMYAFVGSDTTYPGLARPDGTTTGYVRTPQSGLLPYQTGGHGTVGTSSWPFNNGYFVNLYKNGVSVATTDHTHGWTTVTPEAGSSQITLSGTYVAYNTGIALGLCRLAVNIKPTADISSGTSIKIATVSGTIIPPGMIALSIYAGSTNSRRWMGSINSSGTIVVRANAALTAGTTYDIYISGAWHY